VSQLHERLEHLVNYSSQLIFVSSDSIAIQQRNLSEFLALQHESTEVSFFSADENLSAPDYRRTICRQLADHTVGSFVRPLSELLSDLEADKGHYLVCISQAQHIDMAFLNELWEWVTSSRQQNENLHINVILFAEPEWTEKAQSWLPTHHTNKPVLLSSQSVDAVGFDVSALENLMAQKRAFFASDSARSIVRKNWFIVAVLSIFVVIFVALISFQYPEHVKSLLTSGSLPPSADEAEQQNISDENTRTPTSTNADEAPSSKQILLNDDEDEELIASSDNYESQLEIVNETLTDKLLVSNWPAQGEQKEQELDTQTQTGVTELNEQMSSQTGNDEQDFAVDDIVSVQQLNQQLAQALPEQEDIQTDIATDENNAQPIYEFDELQLLQLAQNEFVLQLSGIQNESVLRSYISDNGLENDIWIYQTQRYGGPWFVVLLKASFTSIEDASIAATSLPTQVQQAAPFAKRVSQVQQEIMQN
jgi:DamX protein